jgi:hypothetical protein
VTSPEMADFPADRAGASLQFTDTWQCETGGCGQRRCRKYSLAALVRSPRHHCHVPGCYIALCDHHARHSIAIPGRYNGVPVRVCEQHKQEYDAYHAALGRAELSAGGRGATLMRRVEVSTGGRGGSTPLRFLEHVQRLERMAPLAMGMVGVKPPTVVVVGDQSHGKSSFVQKLVGCPYAFIPAGRGKTMVVGDQSHGKSSFVQKLVGCPYAFIPAGRGKTMVVGDQSHGKSSFVQKLVGCPYAFIPAGRGKTTSCPLIIYTHRKRGDSGGWEFRFEEPRVTDVMRNPGDVMRTITELEAINAESGRVAYSPNPIVLHIYSSAIRHELAIVDTPGLSNQTSAPEEIAANLINQENTITVSMRVPVMDRSRARAVCHDQVMW